MGSFFTAAFQITMVFEGGYANDADDTGGETYKGITRKYEPNWVGWKIIEELKRDFGTSATSINKEASRDMQLQEAVYQLYKAKYWDVNKLDDINHEAVAKEMFDTGVNMGVGTAAIFLQKALNVLNLNGAKYADLVVDGRIGDKTVSAFNSLSETDKNYVYRLLNAQQGVKYMDICAKNPKQEKFMRSWASRLF